MIKKVPKVEKEYRCENCGTEWKGGNLDYTFCPGCKFIYWPDQKVKGWFRGWSDKEEVSEDDASFEFTSDDESFIYQLEEEQLNGSPD